MTLMAIRKRRNKTGKGSQGREIGKFGEAKGRETDAFHQVEKPMGQIRMKWIKTFLICAMLGTLAPQVLESLF